MPYARVTNQKRAFIIAALCEGLPLNAVCRMYGTGKHAVLRVIEETAAACEDWHNRHFRCLEIELLELDEAWSFVHTHKERMDRQERDSHPGRGDCWLWAGIDPKSKAVIQWQIGKRKSRDANAFAMTLASRISGRVQITSDPLNSYKGAILAAFGDRTDYAQEGKVFDSSKVPAHEWPKYRVDPLVGVEREAIHGNPDLSKATVCHAERFFLTVRQENKRYARKTLAYSKLWDNHKAATSVHMFIYNFVRRHEAMKQTPAVALGVTDHRWTLEEVVEMTDRYLRDQEDAKFEAGFEAFGLAPKAARTYAPRPPKTPWYLDPESGGPNPIFRKPGIQYDV